MAKGCQEEKQLKTLLRQLRAVEREQRRHSETATAQRRHVRQRQVARNRDRLHKLNVHEEDTDGEMELTSSRQKRAVRHELCGDPWQHIDTQGWKVVAKYCIRRRRLYGDWDSDDEETQETGSIHHTGEGRFLAYNIYRRMVLLSGYRTGGGCLACGSGAVWSQDAMMDILEQPSGVSAEKPFIASAEDFLGCAQRLTDPAMKLRRVMPEDVGYHSLVTLYASYTLFYSSVVRRLALSHMDVAPVAAWSPLEWTLRRYNALVRLQAVWRGWFFRQRVLYSPHTDLGRRFLMRAWQQDCISQTLIGHTNRGGRVLK